MSNNSVKTFVRQAAQGDVLITRVDVATSGAEVPRDNGRVVLAYGEVTGHAHAIAESHVELFELSTDHTMDGDDAWARAQRLLVTSEAAVIRHEEHDAIQIPAGTYRVTRQREYAPAELRMVAD